MSVDLNAQDVISRLRAAKLDAQLSQMARDHAGELADRLASGVKIVLLGPNGMGKSDLCDTMLSLPQSNQAPEKTRIFSRQAGDIGAKTQWDGTQFTLLENAGLGNAQLVDMALSKDPSELVLQIKQVFDLADIVLWCTEVFGPQETAIWSDAPETLKDHSFLVLTKADHLADHGVLHDRIVALQPVVAEEFHSFFPVTTRYLRELQQTGAVIPDAQWAASGIKALKSAIETLVQSGSRADLDSAYLFLERQGLALDSAMTETCHSPDRPEPTVSQMSPELTLPPPAPFETGRRKIMERAFDLAELSFDEADGDMSRVLELCGVISEEMVEEMRDQSAEFKEIVPWCATFEEASDKIMLMTMENDTRSAADAVTILLQLRRDLEYAALS